jgi:hypothetical protein
MPDTIFQKLLTVARALQLCASQPHARDRISFAGAPALNAAQPPGRWPAQRGHFEGPSIGATGAARSFLHLAFGIGTGSCKQLAQLNALPSTMKQTEINPGLMIICGEGVGNLRPTGDSSTTPLSYLFTRKAFGHVLRPVLATPWLHNADMMCCVACPHRQSPKHAGRSPG